MTTKHIHKRLLIGAYICLMSTQSGLFANSRSVDKQKTMPQQAVTNESCSALLNRAEICTNKVEQLNLCKQAVNMLPPEEEVNLIFDTYKKAGIILYNSEQIDAAKHFLDKAMKYGDFISDRSQIAAIEGYLGWIASKKKQFDTALIHFETAFAVYDASNDYEKIANTYNSIGAAYWYKRDYASALECFNKVLSIGKKIDNSILLRKGLTNKGVVLNNLAQYNEALICLEKALELNQFDNDKKGRAILFNTLGNINIELEQYKGSINNYTEALELYSELENREGISICYNNLGEAYLKLGNPLKALDSYQTSLNILIEEGDSSDIALAYLNIGHAHQYRNDYPKAISYYKKVLKQLLRFDDPALRAEAFLRLGQTLMIKQDYKQAKDYLLKAEKMSKLLDEKVLLAECYNSLSDWHKQRKMYEKALEYKTLYTEVKEIITDELALLRSARMEAVYRLLHKDEQISILEQDNINKSESLELAENTRTTYVIISIALLIIILILILNYQIRRKTERLLTEKNNELKQLNATKDKFFSIISHDLKSPFSSLMGFAEMLALNAETKNSKEVIQYSQIIYSSTKRLFGLVENLLQWSRTQIGTTEFSPSDIDISVQTHNIVSLLRLSAEEKDIVISPEIERNLTAWADENLYNSILRNLINNAIKFSHVGSVIYVKAGVKNHMIEVSVADLGVGIRQENLEKLFMTSSTFSTNGTLNEKGTGLGLVLCKEFVEINKGEIWVESVPDKGSTFYFTLPLSTTNDIIK